MNSFVQSDESPHVCEALAFVTLPDGREYGIITPERLYELGIPTIKSDGHIFPHPDYVSPSKQAVVYGNEAVFLLPQSRFSLVSYYAEKGGVESLLHYEEGERLFNRGIELNHKRGEARQRVDKLEQEEETVPLDNKLAFEAWSNRYTRALDELAKSQEEKNAFRETYGGMTRKIRGGRRSQASQIFHLSRDSSGNKILVY